MMRDLTGKAKRCPMSGSNGIYMKEMGCLYESYSLFHLWI